MDKNKLRNTITPAKFREIMEPSLNEASPKMTVAKDAQFVSDVISRLGVIARGTHGENVKKDIVKTIKMLHRLRSSIQIGR